MATKKICVVTCYKDPDYIRAQVLRQALAQDAENDVIVIKNAHKNVLRYPEVLWKLLAVRFTKNPDIYLLTFRGYEILPFFILLTVGKKRIYDDLINLVEWVVYEHRKLHAGSLPARILWSAYRWLLQRCDVVLTDTQAHADYAAKLMKMPAGKFVSVPVGTDENVFKPQKVTAKPGTFQVLFCGNMRPLYGLEYVIEAALALRDNPQIHFLIAGSAKENRAAVQAMADQAIANGAHITYMPWLPFGDLPRTIAESGLCLAGPFGNTTQANLVITGKTYQFLAMGAPVLLGAIKENGPFVGHENCLLVPQADASALAEQIRWAERHRTGVRAIGEAGRQTYHEYFSVQIIAEMMRQILQEL